MTNKKRIAPGGQTEGDTRTREKSSATPSLPLQAAGRKPILPPLRLARAELVAGIVGNDPRWPFELNAFGYEEFRAAGLTRYATDRAISDLIAMERLTAVAHDHCVVLLPTGAEHD
ncbi:MAG: hypothetical protein EPO21_24705 [Chloroflexota bacterium]|nr:MAG: hypothetical protein EPO21_24705 [Chloroflexota bacterium]